MRPNLTRHAFRYRLLTGLAVIAILLATLGWLLHPTTAPHYAVAVIALGTVVLAILAWRQSSATHMSEFSSQPVQTDDNIEAATLEARLGYRADLLEIMTSSEPRAIILADKWQRILFANAEASRRSGRAGEELIGSTLGALVGPEQAERMRQHVQDAMRTGAPLIHVDDSPGSFSPRITQTSYVPVADTKHIRDAVLITESDITSVVTERERREKMLRQVLDVCVAIVDRRDPHAAGHSAMVGDIARRLASMLGLAGSDIETAEIAGLLMNFGKVLVPQSILTKSSALTGNELALIRKSMLSSADVLSIIQFDLPVVATLRQLHEHFDGTGLPEGRRGMDIIVMARICAVANTFVALVSNRAYRQGKSPTEAISILRQKAGSLYDPKVVDTLEALLTAPDWKQDWALRLGTLQTLKSAAE